MPEAPPLFKSSDLVGVEIVIREKFRDGTVTEGSWDLVPGTFKISESREIHPVRKDLVTGNILELGVVPCSHVMSLSGAIRGDGWEDGR